MDFLKWYLLLLVLGVVNLPVTWSVFQKLHSRGVYLSKVVGLLLWGFVYWWLNSIGLLKNDLASAVSVLAVLLVLNFFVAWKIGTGFLAHLCLLGGGTSSQPGYHPY